MKSNRIVNVLLFSSFVSVALFLARAISLQSTNYWYLNWNLFLAWLPMLFSYYLVRHLVTGLWISWKGLALTALWLAFLPNSFYIATDFIHLQQNVNNSLLFDVVLLLSFTLNGFIVGYISVYAVHRLLLHRMKATTAHTLIGIVFLLCSFAIYLGRYLRWNTWDIILNPAGLLFDVSDRIINPAAHEQTFRTTALFFILISLFYIVIWRILNELQVATLRTVKKKSRN
jgi:uncharacterized membrane protein